MVRRVGVFLRNGATPKWGRPVVAERAGFEPAEHFCSRALQARALGLTMLPLRAYLDNGIFASHGG